MRLIVQAVWFPPFASQRTRHPDSSLGREINPIERVGHPPATRQAKSHTEFLRIEMIRVDLRTSGCE